MRPGSIEVVRIGPPRAGRGATVLIVLAAAASLASAVDGFPLFGFAAVLFVVAALAAAAPDPGAPRLRIAAGPSVSARRRLAVEFFRGRWRETPATSPRSRWRLA
jgi:hypothetical protein